MSQPASAYAALTRATVILRALPSGMQSESVRAALAFAPSPNLEEAVRVGTLRALLAIAWEELNVTPVPIQAFRNMFTCPVAVETSLHLATLDSARTNREIRTALTRLLLHATCLTASNTSKRQEFWGPQRGALTLGRTGSPSLLSQDSPLPAKGVAT